MNRPNFNYCALAYLNQWLTRDSRYCEAVRNPDKAARLKGLAEAAGFYKVARNLPTEFDEKVGLPRCAPVLDVIDQIDEASFEGPTLLSSIQQVRDEISQRYGGKEVISLTTKVLWLKLKSRILIYDSQARRALGEPQGIKAYYDKWLGEFAKVGAQIDAACAALPSVHEYCIRPHQISPSDIQDLASNPWFKERVFDVYLWNKGN